MTGTRQTHPHNNKPCAGSVWLVGAGPGDPGLVTARGIDLVERADVLLHDRLIPRELLDAAPDHCEIIDAGKAPGDHRLTQDQINDLLVARAREGKLVVRLKGGDPYIFGRGFEEKAHCERAGVPCNVVPGVSSSIAAAAAADVPVTLRDVARSFLTITASTGDDTGLTDRDIAAIVNADTTSVLMGVGSLEQLCARLIDAGKHPKTPACVIQEGATPRQRVAKGTLATIARAAREQNIAAPALIVIGPVASHARTRPATDAPLLGKRVVVTRPTTAMRDLVSRLRARGAHVIEAPMIRVEYTDLDTLPDFTRYSWIVFTSLHGVRGFARSLDAHGLDARSLSDNRIAAVGPKTAHELRARLGLRADLVPSEHRAAALVRELSAQIAPGEHVLFSCGSLARDELPEGLRDAGINVAELEVYKTLPNHPGQRVVNTIERGVDAVVLYSPSGARALADLHAIPTGQDQPTLACIGPTTADAARSAGLRVDIVPSVYSDPGMIDALESHFERARAPRTVHA